MSSRLASVVAAAGVSLTLAAGAVTGGVPVRAQAGPTWLAGAAAVEITPPPHSAAGDARDFALCDLAVFSGPRRFEFEEPYIDLAGSGVFDATRDPWCDANHNGRHDDLYSSGGVDAIVRSVHDPIWARALAVGDGTHIVVLETISSIGVFNTDIERIRTALKRVRPAVTELMASSTHNESSPDPLGIYGAPADPTGTFGLRSGVDDYYIDFLVQRATAAATAAVDAMRPARLRVAESRAPDVAARLSKNFPTTNDDGSPAAIDPTVRVLQAVDAAGGANIETLLNFDAHNQQTGHSSNPAVNRSISDDWPGRFAAGIEAAIGGHAMFMPGAIGSIEDPHMVPDTVCPREGCFELAAATGAALAHDVLSALPGAEEIAPHALQVRRDRFDVPLENTLFTAAFAAGLFAHRSLATDVTAGGHPGPALSTEVGFVDLGPQLQILVEPGEAFPALMLGSPWGVEDSSCPGRANPPVPAWHAGATHRFEMGLGNDMIGYLQPAWGWATTNYVDPVGGCATDSNDRDKAGHQHKLEDESVGPDGGNLVATHLAALAATAGDPSASILPGRFLLGDGGLTRRGAAAPVGAWVLPAGSSTFTPGAGTLIAAPGYDGFGARAALAGVFINFDGRAQTAPDATTRGMAVTAPDGSVHRYYVDVFPTLTGASPGPARLAGSAAVAAAGANALPLPSTARASAVAGAASVTAALAVAAFGARRRRHARGGVT